MSEISQPGWNSSTMCLHVLHRNMIEQGWDRWQPSKDYESPRFEWAIEFDLPRRPLDLGVGLWR
jgi:hypothetical protein